MTCFFVKPEWLAKRVNETDISIVDASWYLPDMQRDGEAEFRQAHVPGAVFFDIDAVVDVQSDLPHTVPDAETFARSVGKLGISEKDTIIVYDGAGLFSAARVWWMFRIFGAGEVFILEGGLPAWKEAGLPLAHGDATPEPTTFHAEPAGTAVISFDEMRRAVGIGNTAILDARPAGRFTGEVPEPRPNMRSGHMPGATSLPAMSLVENGTLKPEAELRAIFSAAGIDLSQPAITTCGSGVTAAIVTLALETLGASNNRLYDGSFAEWGSRQDTPIETG